MYFIPIDMQIYSHKDNSYWIKKHISITKNSSRPPPTAVNFYALQMLIFKRFGV